MKTEREIVLDQKKRNKKPRIQAIPKYTKQITRLTTEQMIEVDRLMIEDYKIELIQMMENAGRCLAILAQKRFVNKRFKKKEIVVLAGTGGNGGGALVCARRLSAWGRTVKVFITDQSKMTSVPAHQLDILNRMKVPVIPIGKLVEVINPGLIIDGIIGYNLSGNPYGSAASMINWANSQEAPVLSLDTPSGIDLTLGSIYEPAVKATATLTLALPKAGLYQSEVADYRGALYLGDISVPRTLYAEPSLGLKVKNIFRKNDVVQLI